MQCSAERFGVLFSYNLSSDPYLPLAIITFFCYLLHALGHAGNAAEPLFLSIEVVFLDAADVLRGSLSAHPPHHM